MPKWLLAIIFCILMPSVVFGQEEDRQVVLDMREAFQGLDYDQAEILAGEILARYEMFSVDALIETHVTLALIRYAQNRQNEAELQFISALTLKPDLELDPVLVSPKVRTFFEELKVSREEIDLEAEDSEASRYIFVQDPRPGAAIRSMLVPGWGQFYKNEPVKGYVFVGAWVGSLGATVVTHIRRQDAARSYRIARAPDDIEARYNTYNRTHKLRNALFITAASVWVVSYIDALLTGHGMGVYTPNDRYSISIRPAPAYPYTEIQIAVTF